MHHQNRFFQAEESSKHYTKRILIIEYCESLSTLYKSILLQNGYTILTAACGQEALDMLNVFHPNLIITPNDLADMTSEQLRKEVAKKSKEIYIPVLVLSTQLKTIFPQKCAKTDSNEILSLPFRINDLRSRVALLLGGETINLDDFYYPSKPQQVYQDEAVSK